MTEKELYGERPKQIKGAAQSTRGMGRKEKIATNDLFH